MTVKDVFDNSTTGHMSKKQKTEPPGTAATGHEDTTTAEDVMPSNEMTGILIAATHQSDINIVDFSTPDLEITPEPEPISDSELPPRTIHHKQKKDKKAKNTDKPLTASNDSDKEKHETSQTNKN